MHWWTLWSRWSWRASHVHRWSRHGVVMGWPHSRRHIRSHAHSRRTTRSIGSSRWATHRSSRSHRAHSHVWRRRPRWPISLTLRRRSRTSFLLAFELIQRLFGRQSDNGVLAVQLLFRQTFHHVSHTVLRTERNHTKSFRLSIGTVFEEFHFLKIINAHFRNRVRYILIRCPPGQVADIQLKPPSHMIHRSRPMMMISTISVHSI